MNVDFRDKLISGLLILLMFMIISFSALTARGFSIQTESKSESISVPIFMYHEVKPSKTRKDAITPSEIESDLKYLKSNNYTAITMADLINYVNGKESLPQKPIILSFDDGYYNNYVYVYPLLKKYNMKIVLSIIGKSTDDFSKVSDINLDYSHVTWDQINEMIKSGLVEIQNHTYNMHTITRNRFGCQKNKGESLAHYDQALTEDICTLQKEILSMTGTSPSTFTYPYGRDSKESYYIIKKLGFKASLTCDYGVNSITKNPNILYGLKRICREHGTPIRTSLQKAMKVP